MKKPLINSMAVGLAAALSLAGLSACGNDSDASKELNVFAAASLTESFDQIGKTFEKQHSGTKVTFNYDGSASLATQINESGAPADVFASAAPANMDTVTKKGKADGKPSIFTKNQLVIAVKKGNPDNIKTLADLAKGERKIALCAQEVPCGASAKKALAAGKVKLKADTYEKDVKSALSKVTLGEVDAALVYRTDVNAEAKADAVEFDESAKAINDYPIVTLKDAPNSKLAKQFVEYVKSDDGQAVLDKAGFGAK